MTKPGIGPVDYIFSEFDKRLSIIPRWTITHTLHRQSVAEHCFNVERIAVRIAQQWFRITDPYDLWQISQWALHHDDLEGPTGDIQSPVKPLFDEAKAEELYPEIDLDRYRPADPAYISIVKCADWMEWLVFLHHEKAMGNTMVERMLSHYRNQLVGWFEEKFGKGTALNQLKSWLHSVLVTDPAVVNFARRM